MADEETKVVPESATDAPVQAAPVEKGTQPTPELVTVPLADWQRLQDDVATIKQSQRTAQSDKDKKRAQINKSFARKIAAVDEMKSEEGWDDTEVAAKKKQYAEAAAVQVLELEGLADEESTGTGVGLNSQPPAPQAYVVNTAEEAKQAFRAYLADFELTDKDVPLDQFMVQVRSESERVAVDKKFHQAVKAAVLAKQTKTQKTAQELLDEQEAAAVAETEDKFGGLGGNLNRGAPGDSGRRNATSLDADLGAAYRKRYPTS